MSDNIVIWEEGSIKLQALRNFTLNAKLIERGPFYFAIVTTDPSTSGYGQETVYRLYHENAGYITHVGQKTIDNEKLFIKIH